MYVGDAGLKMRNLDGGLAARVHILEGGSECDKRTHFSTTFDILG